MSRRTGDAVRTMARGLGQTLITVGLVLLLFCAYELWITNIYAERDQNRLGDDLRHSWAEPQAVPGGSTPGTPAGPAQVTVPLGDGLAVIRIPRLGRDYAKVVVEGVGVGDLKKGPGHMPETTPIGEVGNTVVSGHRTTYGAPFNALDRLQPGDAVVLETRDTWFTYRVDDTRIVSPSAIEVTYPVPGDPTATPTVARLTLTTCHPKYSAKQRMVVQATLQSARPKADGDPPALDETPSQAQQVPTGTGG